MKFRREWYLRTVRNLTLALAFVALPASLAEARPGCDDSYGIGYRVVYGLGFDRYGMSSGGYGNSYPGYFGYGMGMPGYGGAYGSYGGFDMTPGAYGISLPGYPSFVDPRVSGIGGFSPIYGPAR